jgi:hypothetical protein
MSGKRFGLRRPIATGAIVLVVTPLVILAVYALGGASPGDQAKRIRELHVTQTRLHEMLAASEARIEAQRRIYMSRLQKVETLRLAQEQELVTLRSRARAIVEASDSVASSSLGEPASRLARP